MDGTSSDTPAGDGPAPRRRSQERCDAIQAAFRESGERRSIRRAAPPLPPPVEPTSDLLLLRLAEELEYARRMIELMGDELATDMSVVMRHSARLQSVDIVGQILGHVANIVRAGSREAAVDRIGMCELKARLTRTSL